LDILKRGGLLDLIEPDEKGLADKGYIDTQLRDKLVTPSKVPSSLTRREPFLQFASRLRGQTVFSNHSTYLGTRLDVAFRSQRRLPGHAQHHKFEDPFVPLVKKSHPLLLGHPFNFKIPHYT
jgi:hypothetical protein